MSDASAPAARTSIAMVILGLLFSVLWIVAHIAWATMAMMGSLMANDSGAASSDQHMALIGGMLGGQITAGAAGIPGGLAFFWSGKRKWMWILFAALFITGAAWQWFDFQSFFAAASSHS
jgi:hypothetical protein